MDELDDLIAFIRSCLFHDEVLVKATAPPGWERSWHLQRDGQRVGADHHCAVTRTGKDDLVADSMSVWDAEYVAARDPAWTLPDIAAKQLLLDKVETWLNGSVSDIVLRAVGLRELLMRFAAAYADRPGFRPEWDPQ